MAVFRVVKTKDFTVMSNHHLKNKELSLKAKGLLSQILSLPDEWDYTLRGLAQINRESVDAIRTAIWELEKAGYMIRRQGRNAAGKMTAIEYIIYEQPYLLPPSEAPIWENPTAEMPMLENPTAAEPTAAEPSAACPTPENPKQSNTHRPNTDPKIKKKSKTNQCRTNQSNPYQSITKAEHTESEASTSAAPDVTLSEDEYWHTRELVRGNIGYDSLIEDMNRERLDEIVEIIVENLCTKKDHFTISGDVQPAWLVKERLWQINSTHIEYIFECLKRYAPRINNIKAYLLATLFNAPATINSYYDARVEHERWNSQ